MWLLLGGGSVALITLVVVLIYVSSINSMIDSRMEQIHTAKSSRFIALFPPLEKGQRFSRQELRAYLEDQGFNQAGTADDLVAGEYAWGPGKNPEGLTLHRPEFDGPGHSLERMMVKLHFQITEGALVVDRIENVDTRTDLEKLDSVPKPLANFLAGRLRTQDVVPLSEIPVSMRHAIMAIEDTKFLEHYGVSLRGIFRALMKNLRAGKASQGGSTITQQLMKNLFFTKQKKISRKLKEALFAFVTEMRYSKEDILEAYLNEVYLGQWSTHEIHGVGEGARYYFNRPATELSLAQSALMAAMVQAPNSLDPRRKPDNALKRRNLVLKKMLEADFILEPEYEMAAAEPLGVISHERSLDDVEYFMDLVMSRLPGGMRDRLEHEALTIYVTLNPFLQNLASHVVAENIERLVKAYPALQKKVKKGMHLQGSLIAINPEQCAVLALQGGVNYRLTQFNRILQGKRQPGSLFKPFVALSGLRTSRPEAPITPITTYDDSPFEWAYDKQIWKPKNYDGKFRGPVTVRQLIEESINVPTARLTQAVGVEPIVESLRLAGIQSNVPHVPSIALGSAEVTPYELAQAFSTIANLGAYCELRPFYAVFDENKNLIADNRMNFEERLPKEPVFQTVHIMKGTLTHGTARSTAWSGLNLSNFAGKTGTTNDAKDAWFVGFSPQLLVLVWVGFDEEQNVGLTGSAAALPIWLDFIKNSGPFRRTDDFIKPENLSECVVDRPALPDPEHPEKVPVPEKYTEYFQKGTEPPGC